MALQNTLRRAGPFTGTGLVSTYPFAFKVFAETDVAVTVSSDPNGLVEETLKLNADYTVSLNEDQDGMPGGSITLATPLAADTRLTIISVVPADQQMELTNHDGFFPTVLNTAFDKATALIQQLEEKQLRAVTVPSTSASTPEALMKDIFGTQDSAHASATAAANSAAASAASASTSKEYADKVTAFKDEIVATGQNISSVVATAAIAEDVSAVAANITQVAAIGEEARQSQLSAKASADSAASSASQAAGSAASASSSATSAESAFGRASKAAADALSYRDSASQIVTPDGLAGLVSSLSDAVAYKIYPELTEGTYIGANGNVGTASTYCATDFIPLVIGARAIVSLAMYNDGARLVYFAADKSVISAVNYTSTNAVENVLDIPDGAAYIRFSTKATEASNTYIRFEGMTNGVSEACALARDNEKNGTIRDGRLSVLDNSVGLKYVPAFVDDVYIGVYGNEYQNAYYSASDFVTVPKNMGIAVAAVMQNDISKLMFYDKFKLPIANSGINLYEYRGSEAVIDPPEGAEYIRYSCWKASKAASYVRYFSIGPALADDEAILRSLLNDAVSHELSYNISYGKTTGVYVHKSGGIVKTEGCFYSDLIELNPGEGISVSGRGLHEVATISKWTADGSRLLEVLTVGYRELGTNTHYAGDEVEYVRVSGIDAALMVVSMIKVDVRLPLKNRIASLFKDSTAGGVIDQKIEAATAEAKAYADGLFSSESYAFAVDDVLCIGDSLTSGACYVPPYTGKSIDQNYPRILGRMLGTNVVNAGVSGYAPTEWYNNKLSTYDLSAYDTFIIWLGTNKGLTDTLDTDVEPFDDYHNYLETETGYYCRIIEAIREANSSCQIILVKIFACAMPVATVNTVIEKIAARYGLPIIDNSDLTVSNHPELHGNVDNPHFSKAGNVFIANRFAKWIGAYMAEDPLRCEFGYKPRSN